MPWVEFLPLVPPDRKAERAEPEPEERQAARLAHAERVQVEEAPVKMFSRGGAITPVMCST